MGVRVRDDALPQLQVPLADLVREVDQSLTYLAADPRLPESTYAKVIHMGHLGLPPPL